MRDTSRGITTILFLVAILFGIFPHGATAQTAGVGALTGTLTDSSGAVVPAATMAVKNEDTGEERSVSTNGDGIYYAPFLQPGSYELTATKPGFAKVVRKGLTLH